MIERYNLSKINRNMRCIEILVEIESEDWQNGLIETWDVLKCQIKQILELER